MNGKEKDDEIVGSGNSYDFGARQYDPRLGRWLSLDPLMTKYPGLSPYNFVSNNPIIFVDVDGKDFIVKNRADREKVKAALTLAYGSADAFSFDKRGKLSIDQSKIHGLNDEQKYTLDKLDNGIVKNENIDFNVSLSNKGKTQTTNYTDEKGNIVQSDVNININQSDFNDKMNDTESGYATPGGIPEAVDYKMDGTLVYNNPSDKVSDVKKTANALLHEVGHVVEDQAGNKVGTPENNKKTVGFENKVRSFLGLNAREGKLHGEQRKDGSYDPKHQGTAEPSK